MKSAQPRLAADDLKARIDIAEFIRSYGVDLRPDGNELKACCPFHDEKTPSFTVTPGKPFFTCFGCGAGGTAIDFVMQWKGCSLSDALRECEQYLGGAVADSEPAARREGVGKKRSDWHPVIPVPGDAPHPPAEFVKRRDGQRVAHPVVASWAYCDAAGQLIGYVNRIEFVKEDGTTGKDVLPCVFARNESTGRSEWRWLSFPKPRPLYGLPDLASRPNAQVLVVEGEKTRDAAQRLLPGLVVVTWPGGSKAISHVDWSPLAGRKVVLWPDRDPAGVAAMEGWVDARHDLKPGVLQHLQPIAAGIRVVDPPAGDDDGWDLADGEAEGWTTDDVMAHIRAAMRDPRPPVVDEPEPPANDNYPPADYDSMPPLEYGYAPPPEDDDSEPFRCLGYGPGPVYYYLPTGTHLVTELSPTSHSEKNMLGLAPLSYWERRYGLGGEMKSKAWTMAANSLIQQSHRKGMFDTDLIRGRGAWWDDGRAAIHLGKAVVLDRTSYSLNTVPSRFVYQQGKRLDVSMEDPLTNSEAAALVKICEMLSWEKPINAKLLAGWLLLAPICGALRWRPHIWVTGPSGSGKSTVMSMIVNRAMGNMAMFVQSATTEAGLRQAIGSDAIPVVFDEAESEDEKTEARINNIMSLVTQASSDTGARIVKGSATGNAMMYNIRSMFAFSSIAINLKQFAAKTRVTVLGLVRQSATTESHDHYKEILRRIDDVLTEEYVRRLHARAIHMIPVVRKNAETFAAAAAIRLGMTRLGDQIGALLAGAYALHSDKEITRQAAEEWIAKQDWSEVSSLNDTSDESQCLLRITQSLIEVEISNGGRVKRTVGEVIHAAAELATIHGLGPFDAQDTIKRYGIKVSGHGKDGVLLISNNNIQLQKLLAGSPWVNAWNNTLARLPGAEKHRQERFGPGPKDTQRCVAIPMSLIAG